MTDLPDINVWLALADENHVHHKRARTYWQNDAPPTVAFCRISDREVAEMMRQWSK